MKIKIYECDGISVDCPNTCVLTTTGILPEDWHPCPLCQGQIGGFKEVGMDEMMWKPLGTVGVDRAKGKSKTVKIVSHQCSCVECVEIREQQAEVKRQENVKER